MIPTAILIGMLAGWTLRCLYAAKIHRPRSYVVECPEALRRRVIGRADDHHYWQEDGGIWEAHTAEAKSQARMRAELLLRAGADAPVQSALAKFL